MQDRLVFLIGSPRSGSTLLSRMLGAHPAVFAPEEPHLITPIAHLGYFESVTDAPYDPIITRQAARALVADLPGGEDAYLAALRSYSDSIYSGLLSSASLPATPSADSDPGSPPTLLLDKTPAYALSLDFLARLYPEAKYIVLTRHPVAVWSSFVDSFFDGDDTAAHAHNPVLERYVPAIARFLRTTSVSLHRVSYENLVQEPEEVSRNLCTFLGIAECPEMVDYGASPGAKGESKRGLGDPSTVAQKSRPTTDSLAKWARAATGQASRVRLYSEIIARLTDDDLETWGYSRAAIQAELDQVDLGSPPPPRPRLTRYALERKVLVALRKQIRPDTILGRLVRKVRDVCDVLLR